MEFQLRSSPPSFSLVFSVFTAAPRKQLEKHMDSGWDDTQEIIQPTTENNQHNTPAPLLTQNNHLTLTVCLTCLPELSLSDCDYTTCARYCTNPERRQRIDWVSLPTAMQMFKAALLDLNIYGASRDIIIFIKKKLYVQENVVTHKAINYKPNRCKF